MKMKRLFWGFMMIAALALLAGCGGGGTSLMIGDDRATQKGINDLLQERDTAQGEVTRLQGELTTATGEVTRLTGELATATGEVTRLTGELATATGDVTRLTGELATATGEVTRLQGELEDEEEKVTSLQTQIANLNKQIADLTNPAEDAMAALLATGIVTAQDSSHSPNAPAPYNDSKRPTASDLTVTVGTDGSKTTVTEGTSKYTQSSSMPPAIFGYEGTMHMRSETASGVSTEDTVTIYEDRMAPTDEKYNDYYDDDGYESGDIPGVDSIADGASGTGYNVLTFLAAVPSDLAGEFVSSKFPSGNSQTYTYYENKNVTGYPTNPSSTDIAMRTFNGTFHGVSGEYACTGSTCTAQTDGFGKLKMLVGDWTFTPVSTGANEAEHIVKGVTPDADYLSFGYWVKKSTEGSADPKYNVGLIMNGSMPYRPSASAASDALAALQGTAKYNGGAAGQFVKKAVLSDGTSRIVDGGAFTADVALEAKFGGNNVAVNDQFMIGGTIDNFHDENGTTIDQTWSVTLKEADFNLSGQTQSYQTSFTNSTMAGGVSGTWGGTFYGDKENVVDDTTTNIDESTAYDYPTGVVGGFDAHFSNGHAIGAFGAER